MCLKPGIPQIKSQFHPYSRKTIFGLSDTVKSQKNSERRKEKSRDAARCRRGKESEIFNELASTLPLPHQVIKQLDKASTMRLCIAFLKTRAVASEVLSFCGDGMKKADPDSQLTEFENDSVQLKALDGFLLVLSKEGDVVYSSENVSTFLGISQVDMMGQSLLDYIHPCDHDEARGFVAPRGDADRHAFLRLKCTLTSKGRNVNLKSASYKVVQISGQAFYPPLKEESTDNEDEISQRIPNDFWIVASAIPIPHPSNLIFPTSTFISKHSLDMKFTYIEKNISELCGYSCEDLLGRSLYEVHHAVDSPIIKEACKMLHLKGQVETGRYRFLASKGGYVWVVTQATLISGSKDSKSQYVACVNYVLSGIEEESEILSDLQLKAASVTNPCVTSKSGSSCRNNTRSSSNSRKLSQNHSQTPFCLSNESELSLSSGEKLQTTGGSFVQPVASTFKLLTDRTKDMNKGYLTFNNNEAVLKDQPDDLTHLAPSCGDDCVPLEIPTLIPDSFTSEGNILLTEADSSLSSWYYPENSYWEDNSPPYKEDSPQLPPQTRFLRKCQPEPNRIFDNGKNFQKPLSLASSPSAPVEENPSTPYIGSSYSLSPNIRFDTPDPPCSPVPLLSQSALVVNHIAGSLQSRNSSIHGRGTLTSGQFPITNSIPDMDLFATMDLKLEDSLDDDDLDLRGSYVFETDDLYSCGVPDSLSSSSLSFSSEFDKLDDETPGFKCLLKKKESPFLRSHSPHKLSETGGNPVDPNQVLPGQFVKAEDEDSSQELRHLLEDSPSETIKSSADSPPPLFSSAIFDSSKRVRSSPSSSPRVPSKRIRSHNSTKSDTPTLQRLLVSKEPITVRGRFISSGNKASASGKNGSKVSMASPNKRSSFNGSHSVLRNLLLNGRDDHAGYTVLLSSLSPAHNSPNSPNSISSSHSSQGSKNESSLPSLNLPVNQDGKVELTREQLSALLGSAGLNVPKIRLLPPVPKVKKLETSTGSTPKDVGVLNNQLAVPSLLDLTSFDFDMNAPAPTPCLLQGADLLMALDQTGEEF